MPWEVGEDAGGGASGVGDGVGVGEGRAVFGDPAAEVPDAAGFGVVGGDGGDGFGADGDAVAPEGGERAAGHDHAERAALGGFGAEAEGGGGEFVAGGGGEEERVGGEVEVAGADGGDAAVLYGEIVDGAVENAVPDWIGEGLADRADIEDGFFELIDRAVVAAVAEGGGPVGGVEFGDFALHGAGTDGGSDSGEP